MLGVFGGGRISIMQLTNNNNNYPTLRDIPSLLLTPQKKREKETSVWNKSETTYKEHIIRTFRWFSVSSPLRYIIFFAAEREREREWTTCDKKDTFLVSEKDSKDTKLFIYILREID